MATTYFLARLIGLFMLSVGAGVLLQSAVFISVLNDLVASRTALFMTGLALLLLGLLVVLDHNVWNAGFPALAVTLIGWLLILRGLYNRAMATTYFLARLIGLFYLTWAGFSA